MFIKFLKLKNVVSRALDKKIPKEICMNEIFLKKSEMLIVAERAGYPDLDKFLRWVDEKQRDVKRLAKSYKKGGANSKEIFEKDVKLFKLGKTSASPVLWKIMAYYFEEDFSDKMEKKKAEITKKLEKIMEKPKIQVIEMDDEGNVITEANNESGSRRSSKAELIFKKKNLEILKLQKDAVTREIESMHKECNNKRQIIMMLTGLTRSLDPLSATAQKKLNKYRIKLQAMRGQIVDETLKREMFRAIKGLPGGQFFDSGSLLDVDGYGQIIRSLKRNMPHHYEDVEARNMAYYTRCRKFRDVSTFVVESMNVLLFKTKKLSKKEELEKKKEEISLGIDAKKQVNAMKATASKKKQAIYVERSMKLDGDVEEEIDEEIEEKYLEMIGKVSQRRFKGEDVDVQEESRKFERQATMVGGDLDPEGEEEGFDLGEIGEEEEKQENVEGEVQEGDVMEVDESELEKLAEGGDALEKVDENSVVPEEEPASPEKEKIEETAEAEVVQDKENMSPEPKRAAPVPHPALSPRERADAGLPSNNPLSEGLPLEPKND